MSSWRRTRADPGPDDRRQLSPEMEPFADRVGAPLADVEPFLASQTNDGHISALLQGLVWLPRFPHRPPPESADVASLPGAYRVLKPFFMPSAVLGRIHLLHDKAELTSTRELVRLLASNRIDEAVRLAWRRLAAAGAPLPERPRRPPHAIAINGSRLLAALAIPVLRRELPHLFPAIIRTGHDRSTTLVQEGGSL